MLPATYLLHQGSRGSKPVLERDEGIVVKMGRLDNLLHVHRHRLITMVCIFLHGGSPCSTSLTFRWPSLGLLYFLLADDITQGMGFDAKNAQPSRFTLAIV